MACLAPATLFSVDIYKRLYRPDAAEVEIRRVTRIGLIVLGAVAIGFASFLPPILASVNWLFSWLVPVFWLVVFGLFWKRSAAVAVATLLSAWVVNCAWSFTALPSMLGMAGMPNAYITLAVTLAIGVPEMQSHPANRATFIPMPTNIDAQTWPQSRAEPGVPRCSGAYSFNPRFSLRPWCCSAVHLTGSGIAWVGHRASDALA